MQDLRLLQIILTVTMLLFAVLSLMFINMWFETYLRIVAGVSLILLIIVLLKRRKTGQYRFLNKEKL